NNSVKSNPFDSWFSDKFGGGSVYDISKREDDSFVYYDIKVGDLNSTSINTKIENGYVSISGTEEKKSGPEVKEGNASTQSIFKSSFSRTFPLPGNVDQAKMQMLTEKDKVVLKFPKKKV
ncbi:MAG: Hsp20/alpha crystallin family protein, partial [Pseudobdellovibrio sp.]